MDTNTVENISFDLNSSNDSTRLFGAQKISKHYGEFRRSSVIVSHNSVERVESKVLVLYTGGTIGMTSNEDGCLVPLPKNFIDKIQSNPLLHDKEYDKSQYEDAANILVLPAVNLKRRILYEVIEYVPLLDSSNMCQSDWVKIALDIEKYYTKFDGFVVLHGTDTLSYTASALSFMLENLGKPVVITGSQISIFQIMSDGVFNFIGSLIVAGNYDIPEVTVFFHNKLIRGNRTIKISSEDFDAFDSPNFPPLVKFGLNIEVNRSLIFRSCAINPFQIESRVNKNVGILRLYPDISSHIVRLFLQNPMEGIILQTYGSGNFPTNRNDLTNELKIASENGVIIVSCSQCSRGRTSQKYETGKILSNIGIVEAHDMTPEAALTKLVYILSKSELSLQEKKNAMCANIRGELTSCIEAPKQFNLTAAVAKFLNISEHLEICRLQNILFPAMFQSAVHQGDINKIEEIRKYGADLSITDFDSRNILHIACSAGQEKVVKYCLKNGVNVHKRDKYDMNPLHEAVIADQHKIIKILRKAGAHLSNEPRFLGDVLTNAAARGMITRLKSYMLAGANLNLFDSLGISPIQAAVINRRKETVEFLLSHNADRFIRNKLGQNAIEIAVQMGANEITDLLMDDNQPLQIYNIEL